MVRTPMMKRYFFNLTCRVLIFLSMLYMYLFHKSWLVQFVNQPIRLGITPIHILWLYFMIMMIRHLIPSSMVSMALKKARVEPSIRQEDYSSLEMYQFIQDQNVRAWSVMLVWLIFNGIWGLLYLLRVLDDIDLVMLSVFYFLCDYICILFFCPFQTFIMKNRCCINCRIYDWGHFMMFTPMLFIRNFFSWSLFFTACVVLIHWEIQYIRHPERFWYGSNEKLRCQNCKDKTCQLKKRIVGSFQRHD